MPQPRTVNSKHLWHLIAIITIAIGVFLVGLNRISVPTVDGAVRASMARHIISTGQLWPISYEGQIFTDHPPLYLWLTALSYKIFGMNDFAVNVVPRFFAFLTVIITALIALQAGYSRGVALAAALILCLTRDFILSSVRGYIEPVLEFFIYAGVYFTLIAAKHKKTTSAAIAGLMVWLAAYSKGPVALWPFLFCAILIRRPRAIAAYLGAFVACTAIWALWVQANGHWPYWADYLNKQVLGSALEGRGGAQQLEPLYFVNILTKYYWPWIPFFVVAAFRTFQKRKLSYEHAALLFAFGFIGAFSLMKWKFWYYIAPAYPAMALLIAMSFKQIIAKALDRDVVAKYISYAAMAWILVASIAPIKLHHERVPEVLAFKDSIRKSELPGPIWYIHNPVDHNMIATSGNWYFERTVEKVTNEEEWMKTKLKAPAWIITGTEYFKTCKSKWCEKSIMVQSTERSALLHYNVE